MRRRLAAGLAILTMLWLPPATPPPPVAQAASVCTGWTNWLSPPPTIRVNRTFGPSAGTIQKVDFKTYVKIVMASEFPASWDAQTLQAGAVAVKQYAWYFTMHYRGGVRGSSCYDVVDTTADQLYSPETRSVAASLANAVDASWTTTIQRNGSFVMTGYRAGGFVACGADADGYHMFQNSAHDCGVKGRSAAEILQIYYGPGLKVIRPTAGPVATFFSAPKGTTTTARASAIGSWLEETWTGRAITGRTVTLVRAKPVGGSCAVDRWLPAMPPWSSTGASPQSVAGLQSGFCYRFIVSMTDAAGTTEADSGAFVVDPAAPVATFQSPASGRVTSVSGTGADVSWTETPAAGATIAARSLVQEYALAPRAGTCAGADWRAGWTKTAASPAAATAFGRLYCYRYRLTLTDSAGHSGTSYSGVFLTTATAG